MTASDRKIAEYFIKSERFTQGVNAYPIFLLTAALCAFKMKEKINLGYEGFIFKCEKAHAEMNYLIKDLRKGWIIIEKRLKKDPNYLAKVKKDYDETFVSWEKFFEGIRQLNLSKFNNDELMKLLNKAAWSACDSVGTAHIVEFISFNVEEILRQRLLKKIGKISDFNPVFAQLTSPSKPSFLMKEELELARILSFKKPLQKQALIRHQKKYYWLGNSYAGRSNRGLDFFARRLLKINKKISFKPIGKTSLIKRFKLDNKSIELIKLIDFTANWQDERKSNIMKATGYLGLLIEEVSRRTKIPLEYLYYMGATELLAVKNIKDFARLDLKRRIYGTYYIQLSLKKEIITWGEPFKELGKLEKSDKHACNELEGSVANPGFAKGKVKICLRFDSFAKFRKGDVLVASMTRPEYMPILRKAAAIVNDEGGITSHAAIVSRELGIPCIIGTKIATKVLKDGNLVEVDATKGIIKKL